MSTVPIYSIEVLPLKASGMSAATAAARVFGILELLGRTLLDYNISEDEVLALQHTCRTFNDTTKQTLSLQRKVFAKQ